jgi:hypothetical protein
MLIPDAKPLHKKQRHRLAKQQARVEKFNAAAQEAYDAFPRQLSRLVVIADHMLAFAAPDVVKQMMDLNNHPLVGSLVSRDIDKIADNLASLPAINGVSQQDDIIATLAVDSIAIKTEDGGKKGLGDKKDRLWTLDHEIGHQIVRNGHYVDKAHNVAESAAEAYATLRHLQRNRNDMAHIDYLINNISLNPIFSDTDRDHYTAGSIVRAVETAHKMGGDFYTMSLQETAALAATIADETGLSDEKIAKIWGAYEGARNIINVANPDLNAACTEIFAVMKQYAHDADIVRAGELCLNVDPLKGLADKLKPDWRTELKYTQSGPARKSPHKKSPVRTIAL